MPGWVKLHRSMADHWLFSFDEPDKTLAWIDLIMLARHADGVIMLKGRPLKVMRGDVAISQLTMQKRWKWSQNKVKRFLKLLKNERMVDFKTNDLTTIVTICNYEQFQGDEQVDERTDERTDERPVERTANDQSNDDIRMKEGKEGKEGNKGQESGAAHTRSVISSPPNQDEVWAYMVTKGLNGTAPVEAEKFIDHFTSNGWRVAGKAPMKCWKAAARNWIKRVQPIKKIDDGFGGFR